ncbi:hypothetical protein [Yersinia ruckeri]|uniref:hypothetical protein n=1 Tax=Yersinia ruckeri TaxID=29486 RepID=UPI002237940A|nr:hypothetical protein [Yersinia ruckeri]MCW6598647.1 hypothetical protein [Yersinia ruckeri]
MERIALSLPEEFLECQLRNYAKLLSGPHGLAFILEIPDVTEEMKDQAKRMNLAILPADNAPFIELTAGRLIDFTKNYLATEKQELVEVFFNMLEMDYSTLNIAERDKLSPYKRRPKKKPEQD